MRRRDRGERAVGRDGGGRERMDAIERGKADAARNEDDRRAVDEAAGRVDEGGLVENRTDDR